VASHNEISIIGHIHVCNAALHTCLQYVQRLPLERANTRHNSPCSFNRRQHACKVVQIRLPPSNARLKSRKGNIPRISRSDYNLGARMLQDVLHDKAAEKAISAVHHNSRQVCFDSLETGTL